MINIYQQPNQVSLGYDMNPLVLTSTLTEEENFHFLYYLQDRTGVITSLKQTPSPENLGIFNPNVIAKSMLENNFSHTTLGITDSNECVYQFKIIYSSLSDGLYDVSGSTNIINLLNGVSKQLEYPTNINDYCLSGTSSKWLSDYNNKFVNIYPTDYYTLSFINGSFQGGFVSSVNYVVFEMTTTGGTIQKYCILNPDFQHIVDSTTFNTNYNKIVKNIGVGCKNLLSSTSLLTYPGLAPVTLPSTYFNGIDEYQVYTIDNNGSKTSQSVYFTMNCKRGNNKHQIFYYNNVGGWDSITFNNGNWVDITSKTTTYTKSPYTISGNNQYGYVNGSRGLQTLAKSYEKILTVVTDINMYDDIVENFILSSSHYLVDGTTIIPLVIDTEKHKRFDPLSRRINSYEISFNYANKTNQNV